MHPPIFPDTFKLWPSEAELARDMRVPRWRARKWVERGYAPPWYWPRLVDVAELKFGRQISYQELVMASMALRGPDARRRESEAA